MRIISTNAGDIRTLLGHVEPAKVTDVVDAVPDVRGAHGRAWLCDLSAARRARNIEPEEDGTHEIWLYALDPDCKRNAAVVDGINGGSWLQPKNFAAQFIEIADELAQDRVRSAVQKVCDGRLSPDVDFMSQWAVLFGNNMLKDRPGYRPPISK